MMVKSLMRTRVGGLALVLTVRSKLAPMVVLMAEFVTPETDSVGSVLVDRIRVA